MRFRFYILFPLFALLFLFYPGNSMYFRIFAQHKDLFEKKPTKKTVQIHPIPVVTTTATASASAQGIYVLDLNSYSPIYALNEHNKLYPASTTKIMTALVAFDLYKPDDVITIQKFVNDGQTMNLVKNEKITLENLLYGSLVQSGNDAASAIAYHYGYDQFIEKMNQKAQDLGMKDTTFTNPTGLHDPNHISSPFDMALAGRALLANPYLRKIVGTKEITISDVDYKYFHRLTNVNRLLGEIPGLGGLKTGYTDEAGENLISFYKSNNHEYLIVIQKSQDRFADTKNVVDWIEQNVKYVDPPAIFQSDNSIE